MDDCLARVITVTQATTGAHLGDDSLFNYAARIAMGFARIKAQYLSADLNMLAVWNGQQPNRQAGTAVIVGVVSLLMRTRTTRSKRDHPHQPRQQRSIYCCHHGPSSIWMIAG